MLQFALVEGFKPELEFSEPVWLEAIGARVYHTPQYGKVPLTVEKVQRMVKNFKENIRGQEIATNFDHGADAAKGNKASGWFRDFKVAPSSDDPAQMSLYAAVQFTEEAAQEIKTGAWKYFSLEWDDLWVDNKGAKHEDVIVGGAITNRPTAKNLAALPINFSETLWNELTDDEKKRYTRLIKTKSKRQLSEEVANAVDVLTASGFTVVDESKEWEHSEPGTGSPPAPRRDEDGSDDPAIGGGWRRDPLPLDPSNPNAPKPSNQDSGGSALTPEQLKELKEKLGLADDATDEQLIEAAGKTFSELAGIKTSLNQPTEEKRMAEQFPAFYAEHLRMREDNNSVNATKFSESVQTITKTEGEKQVDTRNGLSALAITKVTETHKKFSEGTATQKDFEDTIDAIVHGGIVEFGEVGSSVPKIEPSVDLDTTSAEGLADARKKFSELVAAAQVEDKELDMRQAIAKVAAANPELAAAYRRTMAA